MNEWINSSTFFIFLIKSIINYNRQFLSSRPQGACHPLNTWIKHFHYMILRRYWSNNDTNTCNQNEISNEEQAKSIEKSTPVAEIPPAPKLLALTMLHLLYSSFIQSVWFLSKFFMGSFILSLVPLKAYS